VLGAIVRDQIERRGLPYHETLYGCWSIAWAWRPISIPPTSPAI